jgi:hypothetical protein
VTVPPAPRGRKRRLVRPEDVPDDLMLVIRAMPDNRSAAVEEMVDRAQLSASVYVVEQSGKWHLLYGVSVFAHRPGRDATDVLRRFPRAPMFVEAPVGAVRAAGFEVVPTGSDADHFDVQLVDGVAELDAPPSEAEVRAAAIRLLDAAGEWRPNPSYAGEAGQRFEED